MLEFVCLPWSEVCSARVTSLLLLLLLLLDSISTKDLMEKTHQLPISVMIKREKIKMART